MNKLLHGCDDDNSNQKCDVYVSNANLVFDLNGFLEKLVANLNELFNDEIKNFNISRSLLNYLAASNNRNTVQKTLYSFIITKIQDFFDDLEKFDSETLLKSWIKLSDNIEKITKYFIIFDVNIKEILNEISYPKDKLFYDNLVDKIIDLMKVRNYRVEELIRFLYRCNLKDFNLHQRIEIRTSFVNLKDLYSYSIWLKDLFPNNIYKEIFVHIIQNQSSYNESFFSEITSFVTGVCILFDIYEQNNKLNTFFSELENIILVQKSILSFLTNILLVEELPTKLQLFIYNYIDDFDQDKFSNELSYHINFRFINLKSYLSQKELVIYHLFYSKIKSPEIFYNLHTKLLIQRLINHRKYSDDADLRFSMILNDYSLISIIKDFGEHSLKIKQSNDKKIIFSVFHKDLFNFKDIINVDYSYRLDFLDSYETMHKSKFPNTKLKWDFELTRCVIQPYGINNLESISCNGIFGILLIELNYTNDINKIIQKTCLKSEIVESCIHYLIKIEVIKKMGNNIKICSDYKDKIIIIPSLKYSENNLIQQNFTSAQIESFIIRYLKINGKRDENEIYSRVLKNFPSISHENISKRINSLISKEFILKDEKSALIVNF